MPFGNQELTDTGVSYLTQAQLGDELRIRRMVVGSGIAANLPDDLWPLTALIAYEIDVPITSSEYVTPDTLKVVGLLDSTQIPSGGGFDLNEIGLMVECGTLPEALYSVDNTGGNGDQIPDRDSASPVIQQLELYIKIARVDNISINVQPAGTYDAVNRGLATVGPGPYIEKVGDVLHFKRFVAGEGIEILDDALTPSETIIIGLKKLIVDLDLYVPLAHPLGTPETSFATIQEALDSLDAVVIPPERMATIHVYRGVHVLSSIIMVDHPQSDRIRLLGDIDPSVTITSVGATTGVAGNYSIPVNVSSAAGIAVDDMVGITNLTGNYPAAAALHGAFLVVGVTGNTVTIQLLFNQAFGNIVVTGGTMFVFKTVLAPEAAATGALVIRGKGLLALNNFAITAIWNSPQVGIFCEIDTVVSMSHIGIMNFNILQGISCANCRVTANTVFVSRCDVGIYASDAVLTFSGIVSSYSREGIRLSLSSVSLSSGWIINCTQGLIASPQSGVSCTGNVYIYWHGTNGIYIGDQSSVTVTGASQIQANYSTTDIALHYLSAATKAGGAPFIWTVSNQAAGFSNVTGCYLCPSGVLRDTNGPSEEEELKLIEIGNL